MSTFLSPYLYFLPQLPISPHIPSQADMKPMNTDVNVQHLQENMKSASTKRGTILEGNAAEQKTGNLFRETGSVYFYLINDLINLLCHLTERNVELVKLHTYHIFIRYKTKM